jgi:cell division protein FtsB
MPELTVIHIGLLALMLVIGVIVGWMVRGDRCAKEKIAVNASWQDQIQSQQSEHGRLAEQNKSLMEQISQYQASQKDHSNRAKDLSDSLKVRKLFQNETNCSGN